MGVLYHVTVPAMGKAAGCKIAGLINGADERIRDPVLLVLEKNWSASDTPDGGKSVKRNG